MPVKFIFWILFLLNLLNYIDRQVLYAVFPLVQRDLMLSDGQLGLLGSVFMLVYMCYAPVVGYFAARTPRRYWIGMSALIWSLATLACACVKSYAGLLVARSACGAGEGGFTTLAQPFLAEHCPKEKRATVLSLFGLALPIGAALGYLLGGVLGAHFGWRAAFIWVGLPGLVLGMIAFGALKEPLEKERKVKPGWREYGQLFKNKPFLWICLAHAMVTFVMGGLSAWMPTYFVRYYAMDVEQAGAVFGVLVIVSGAMGTYAGGKWADRLLVRFQDAYYRVMWAGMSGALVFALGGIFISYVPLAVLSIGGAVACLFMPLGPIAAALVKVTQPAVRPMAFALNIFIIHILGDALSPVFIGQAANWEGLKTAVVLAVVGALPAGMWCVGRARKSEQMDGRSLPG